MIYMKIYNDLIDRGRNRKLTGYKERHHIIPRCMGGSDKKINLVELTAREHFIAHLLLVKIYPNHRGLVFAANMMCLKFTHHRINNRRYEWLRIKVAAASSALQSGPSSPNRGRKLTDEQRQKISQKAKERDPETRKHRPGRKKAVFDRQESSKKAWSTRRQNGLDKMSNVAIAKLKETKSNQSLEIKQKPGKLNKGRKHSLEVRKQRSISNKGRIAHNKGINASLETKIKIGNSLKNNVTDYVGDELCCYGCGNRAIYKRVMSDTDKTVKFSCVKISAGCPEIVKRRTSKKN